jgi:hypothetical protein
VRRGSGLSSVSGSGDVLTVNLHLRFQPSFAETKQLYLNATDQTVTSNCSFVNVDSYQNQPPSGFRYPIHRTRH